MTARLTPRTHVTEFAAPCPCGRDATWTATSHSPTGEAPFDLTYRIDHPGECQQP